MPKKKKKNLLDVVSISLLSEGGGGYGVCFSIPKISGFRTKDRKINTPSDLKALQMLNVKHMYMDCCVEIY